MPYNNIDDSSVEFKQINVIRGELEFSSAKNFEYAIRLKSVFFKLILWFGILLGSFIVLSGSLYFNFFGPTVYNVKPFLLGSLSINIFLLITVGNGIITARVILKEVNRF
jgi:hypothetical protein